MQLVGYSWDSITMIEIQRRGKSEASSEVGPGTGFTQVIGRFREQGGQ